MAGLGTGRARQVFFEMRWHGRIGARCAAPGDRKPPRWARLAKSHQDARPLAGFHRNARESQGPQPHAPHELAGRTLEAYRSDPQRTAMTAHLSHFLPSMHIPINSCRRRAHASAGSTARRETEPKGPVPRPRERGERGANKKRGRASIARPRPSCLSAGSGHP